MSLQKEFWPDLESEDFNKTDLQLTYSYIFSVGFPPAMFAQVCKFIIWLRSTNESRTYSQVEIKIKVFLLLTE